MASGSERPDLHDRCGCVGARPQLPACLPSSHHPPPPPPPPPLAPTPRRRRGRRAAGRPPRRGQLLQERRLPGRRLHLDRVRCRCCWLPPVRLLHPGLQDLAQAAAY